ncbi:hypothetical protein GM3708_509 [Geminocystis sp. NIES-3708]|nr:hypothetical protein GM3708_509 [Geminocystis sp. NIES-3708]
MAGGFVCGSIIPILFKNNNNSPQSKNNKNRKKQKKSGFKKDFEEEKDPIFDWD